MDNKKPIDEIYYNLRIANNARAKTYDQRKEWEEFYMGNDGNYTFYIDMVKGEFAKNSISKERFPIGNKTMDEMFHFILNKYNKL